MLSPVSIRKVMILVKLATTADSIGLDIPPATALLSLIQLLGGTCGIAIAQSVCATSFPPL